MSDDSFAEQHARAMQLQHTVLRYRLAAHRGGYMPRRSTLIITVIGNERFATHVVRTLGGSTLSKAVWPVESRPDVGGWNADPNGWTRGDDGVRPVLMLKWISDLVAICGKGPIQTDVVICDRAALKFPDDELPVCELKARDGHAPALLGYSRDYLSPAEWTDVERHLGVYLVDHHVSVGYPDGAWVREGLLRSLGLRAARIISDVLYSRAVGLGEADPVDPVMGAIGMAIILPSRFPREAHLAAAADRSTFNPDSPIELTEVTDEQDGARKKYLARRLKKLGIVSAGALLGLCRLLHACLRHSIGRTLYADQEVDVGGMAVEVGIQGERGDTADKESARRTLNELSARHFEGLSFREIVPLLDPLDFVDLFGPRMLGPLWFRPEPAPVVLEAGVPIHGTNPSWDAWLVEQIWVANSVLPRARRQKS